MYTSFEENEMIETEKTISEQEFILSEKEIRKAIVLAGLYYESDTSTSDYYETICFNANNRRKYSQTFDKVKKLYSNALEGRVVFKYGQEFKSLRNIFDSSRLKDNEYVDEVIKYFVRSIGVITEEPEKWK